MPTDPHTPSEQEQRRLTGMLGALAEQETARLHTGTLPWTWWLDRAATYGQYGFTNTLVIAAQYRFASDVRSYDQWKAQGRQVRKGEHGIRIISRTGRPRAVFDRAQTDGLPVSEQLAPSTAAVISQLRQLAAARGVFVDRYDNRWPTAVTSQRRISVRPELTEIDAAGVLAHQIGHLLLHREPLDQDTSPACHGVRHVEANSIAYLLLARLGLDPSGLDFPPVTSWAGGDPRARPLRTIATVGDRILRTASRIGRELQVIQQTPDTELSPQAARTPTQAAKPAIGSPSTALPGPPVSPASLAAASDTATSTGTRQTTNTHAQPDGPSRADLIEMHTAAHQLFLAQHAKSWVPAYLTGRGFDRAVQAQWEVGFAPRGWRVLTDHLRTLGYTDDTIVASGLARRRRGGTLFDTFRNRAMLPFRNPAGSIVGFIGRLPKGGEGPKYLNNPETLIFRKSELLFGLYETCDRLARGARPVIVEGPLDAIAVNTASPDHAAVSPCGTTLTAQHLITLARSADLATTGLLLALDGDRPGQDAAVRAWETILQLRGPMSVIRFPENLDPADLFNHHGHMDVCEALRSEVPLADVVVDAAIAGHEDHLQFTEGKLAAARTAAHIIARLPPDQMARQVARVATVLGIAPAIVTDALASAIAPEPSGAAQLAGDDFPLPPLTSPAHQTPRATTRTSAKDRPRQARSA
jgi:DNA primase